MAFSHQFTAVASGDTISAIADVEGASILGLTVPNSLDSEVFLQAAWDQTSANFARVARTGSGDGDWNVGSSSTHFALSLENVALPFPYLRFELGAAATITATFTVYSKRF